jgi:hypothetical protein
MSSILSGLDGFREKVKGHKNWPHLGFSHYLYFLAETLKMGWKRRDEYSLCSVSQRAGAPGQTCLGRPGKFTEFQFWTTKMVLLFDNSLYNLKCLQPGQTWKIHRISVLVDKNGLLDNSAMTLKSNIRTHDHALHHHWLPRVKDSNPRHALHHHWPPQRQRFEPTTMHYTTIDDPEKTKIQTHD